MSTAIPTPADSNAIKIANEFGFPLQIAVETQVTQTTAAHGWKVRYSEHSWANRSDQTSGFIDLVLQDKYGNTFLVVECKRKKKIWVSCTWMAQQTFNGMQRRGRLTPRWNNEALRVGRHLPRTRVAPRHLSVPFAGSLRGDLPPLPRANRSWKMATAHAITPMLAQPPRHRARRKPDLRTIPIDSAAAYCDRRVSRRRRRAQHGDNSWPAFPTST
jgi:hypothetical protein